MDNLEQLWCRTIKINEEKYGKCKSCSSSQEFACFISDQHYVCLYEYSNPDSCIVKNFEEKDLKVIHYLAVYDTIFLATDYELILCDRNTLQCNVCYESDRKIVALAWNPTETAVVLIDEQDQIFLCNFTIPKFKSDYSNNLNAEVPNSVYVGWGSENTQFQGPKSRQRKEKDKVSVPLIELKYSPPQISWRGNGQLFAVNYYKNGQRFVKVFDSQLQPLNVSSEYPNLTSPIAFMVAGQSIACVSVGLVNTIIIFEKNCKLKSTFEVPENKGTVRKLQYHSQRNMLAVYSLDEKENGYINIYLNENNVWLLKQQLYFPPNRVVQNFDWINLHEPVHTVCRLVVFTTQSIEYYTFRFIINRSPVSAVVGVVNGRNISWHNFEEKIVPPPMMNYTQTLSRPINRILFHPQKLLCVTLDSLYKVSVIDLKNFSELLNWEDLHLANDATFHSAIWSDDKIQINFKHSSDNTLAVERNDNLSLEIRTVKETASKFYLPYNDTNILTSYQNLDGKNSSLIYLTKKLLALKNSEIELEFALSSNRELYVNECLICNGVTSFFVFKDYLLLTTAGCKLYCIRLLQDYDALLHSDINLDTKFCRQIEQGARIVTVVNGCPPIIVLILPRGNLETIRCRLLTVDIIEKLLSENNWKAAVDLTRIERMNWNLLVDLNPQRFSEHIKDFVKAAEFATNLSMIVNDFTNKNDFYKNCLPVLSNIEYDKSDIINRIISYLISVDIINNLCSIVSIQDKHVSLRSALSSIKRVFELNPHSNETVCKKALQLLSNKKNFKDILEAAYSLYSLDFLTFVYHNSIEDPRIYEPEIALFRNLKPIELRFKMSLKANNTKEAVKYLLRCDEYDKAFVEDFILKHKLADVAYKSIPPFYKHFETISILYAKHLSLKQRHEESAFVLRRANLISQALEEYKKSLNWREVLSIMAVLKYNQDEQRKVLYDLSDRLSGAGRVEEAVLLIEKYNNDYKKAIEILIEHKAFGKAICLAKQHNAVEVLEELVIPTLKSYMLDLKEKITEYEVTFKKYFNRLQSLRKEKEVKLDNSIHGIYEGDDLYSETGSTVSSYGSSRATSRSRSSQLSSKNRRKEARKKIDLREGGYYEDIALIRALHILYSDVSSLSKEVREVCLILEHNDFQLAIYLHTNLSSLQDVMKKHICMIWPDVFINVPQVVNNKVLAIVENKADLDPEYCVPPENLLSEEWKLEFFS